MQALDLFLLVLTVASFFVFKNYFPKAWKNFSKWLMYLGFIVLGIVGLFIIGWMSYQLYNFFAWLIVDVGVPGYVFMLGILVIGKFIQSRIGGFTWEKFFTK